MVFVPASAAVWDAAALAPEAVRPPLWITTGFFAAATFNASKNSRPAARPSM